VSAATRLYAILARDSHRAVVFRRGPSKQVLLISWNTDNDRFSVGQWLKGRIYERRCDLSPSGDLLIYFAAKYREPFATWTAISRPPFLTALVLWPQGHAWGGGGLFESDTRVLVNHRTFDRAPGFQLPGWLEVDRFGEHSGHGEDDPVWHTRLRRDGWELRTEGKPVRRRWGTSSSTWIELSPPMEWARPHPHAPHVYELQMIVSGIKEQNGPWYVTEHLVLDKRANTTISLGRTDWADWCRSGDLLFAGGGQILRARPGNLDAARVIADFSDSKFASVPPTKTAQTWPKR
jgi:hypothetical protein